VKSKPRSPAQCVPSDRRVQVSFLMRLFPCGNGYGQVGNVTKYMCIFLDFISKNELRHLPACEHLGGRCHIQCPQHGRMILLHLVPDKENLKQKGHNQSQKYSHTSKIPLCLLRYHLIKWYLKFSQILTQMETWKMKLYVKSLSWINFTIYWLNIFWYYFKGFVTKLQIPLKIEVNLRLVFSCCMMTGCHDTC
jgi:hypothetical protein